MSALPRSLLARSLPARIVHPPVVHPRFGGRPVRRPRSDHPVAVVMALVGAIAAAAVAMPLAGAPARADAFARMEQAAPAGRGEARTTEKSDRLRPPAPPVFGGTCDGAWGNEPLECLLQSA